LRDFTKSSDIFSAPLLRGLATKMIILCFWLLFCRCLREREAILKADSRFSLIRGDFSAEGAIFIEDKAAENLPASPLVRDTKSEGGEVHIRAVEFSILALRRVENRYWAASI
jgi:hypothetical protein